MDIFSKIKTVFGSRIGGSFFWDTYNPENVWSKDQQLAQFTRYVHSIVSAIAQDVAGIEFVVQEKKDGVWVPKDDHEIVKLLQYPNSDQSKFDFIEMHTIYTKLVGESFWYTEPKKMTKTPTQLRLLMPTQMSVAITKGNRAEVKGYILGKGSSEETPFERDEVIHFKTPNPRNPFRGMSVVEAAMQFIQTEEYAGEWTKKTIYNSGRPSGIVNFNGTIDSSEFDKVKRRFKQEYSGIKNSGKTLFVRGNVGGKAEMDFKKIGVDLGDIDLKGIKDMTRDDIMMMFRISKTMMGISEGVNFANAKVGKSVWIENIIKPEMKRIVEKLNYYYKRIHQLKDNERIWYNDPNPERVEDKKDEWSAGINKWLTINDIRQERGLDPIEGGDVLYQPLNLVPMGQNDPNQDPVTPSKGVTVLGTNKKADIEHSTRSKKKELDLNRRKKGEVFWKELYSAQEKWQNVYRTRVNKIFKHQLALVLARTEAESKKEFAEFVFDKTDKAIFYDLLVPLTVEVLKDQALKAFAFTGDDMELEINPEIMQMVRERVSRFADSTNQITIDQLSESIAEGINAGESISKLRKRVREVFADASKTRSKLISRTETIWASNEGANRAYKQNPVVIAKEWMSEIDACPFCASLNGKVIGLETNFAEVGHSISTVNEEGNPVTYNVDYENVGHPPLHPQCRCTVLPVREQ